SGCPGATRATPPGTLVCRRHHRSFDRMNDADTLIDAARELLPLVRAEAAAGEAQGRTTPALLAELHARRLFRLFVPRSIGGEELPLVPALEIFELVSSADGAAGWTVMIGAGAGLFGAFLPPASAREILGPDDAVIAGSGAPHGTAREVDGGYRVSGRWSYASGARHATWFTANCVVHDPDGRPRRTASGEPLVRAVAVPAAEVQIHSTWDVVGLRGTGSEDFEIADRFVPSEHTFSALADPPVEQGPLYRVPFVSLAELSFAAVALGIARGALEEFRALARTKRPLGATEPLAADPDVRVRYARAEGAVRASRALVFEEAARTWETVERGDTVDSLAQLSVRLACVDAARRSARAVDELHARAGMTPLFSSS